MKLAGQMSRRDEAQELMWDAMDLIYKDEEQAARLCRKALEMYPDCIDALTMLAEIESERACDYVVRMRKAVEAGRRDLGLKFFKENTGYFWGLIETRPFMRAMAMMADTHTTSACPQQPRPNAGLLVQRRRPNSCDSRAFCVVNQ